MDVRELQEQPTAVIRWRGPAAEIGEAVRNGLGRTYEALQRAGAEPSGPPVVRYLGMGPDEFEAEIGWPVPVAFTGDGGVVASSLPAGRVAAHCGGRSRPDRACTRHSPAASGFGPRSGTCCRSGLAGSAIAAKRVIVLTESA